MQDVRLELIGTAAAPRVEELPQEAKRRYIEKIAAIVIRSVDPFTLQRSSNVAAQRCNLPAVDRDSA